MKNSEVFKNVRVDYEVSATVNTGDFQNVKPLYRISADVIDGVSPTEAKDRLRQVADAWMESHLEEIQKELHG